MSQAPSAVAAASPELSGAAEPQTSQDEAARDVGWIWLAALALYAFVALMLTWPLGARLGSDIPLGSLHDTTVPWFNFWSLEWNADRLRHFYADYWDAPLFYPARDGFALSEPQALTGLVFAPLAWLFGSVAAYSLTLLITLLANALAARWLLRSLGVSPACATWAGLLALGLPFVLRELGVLQLTVIYPVLLGLAELGQLIERPQPGALLRLALCLAATLWTCLYYALFFAVVTLLAAPFVWRRGLRWPPLLAAGTLGVVALLVLSWPIVSAQRRAVSDFQRSEAAVHAGSASALAYLQFPKRTLLARALPFWARSASKRTLYPGLVLVGLAGAGGWAAARSGRRRFALYALLALGVSLFLSFGTRWSLAGFRPYESLIQHVLPGFAQLRSPYRAALFVQLFLLIFAGWGLDALQRRASPGWSRRLLPAGVVLVALLEFWPQTIRPERFPSEALGEPWISWLAAQPGGAIAMVPPAMGNKVAQYPSTVLGMLQALRHGHPIVNGYSGFFPAQTDRLIPLLQRFPSASGLRALREVELRYVVIDEAWLQQKAPQLQAAEGLRPVFTTGPKHVYALDPTP